LFAYKEAGILQIDNCGNSAELSEADEKIREIENLLANMKLASDGDIGGRVVANGADALCITVTARRGGKKYTAVTDHDGHFHIRVPPGKYVVWPETTKWIVTPYDLSYDNEAGCLLNEEVVQTFSFSNRQHRSEGTATVFTSLNVFDRIEKRDPLLTCISSL
jgi:hypothetical protein